MDMHRPTWTDMDRPDMTGRTNMDEQKAVLKGPFGCRAIKLAYACIDMEPKSWVSTEIRQDLFRSCLVAICSNLGIEHDHV